MTCKMIDMDRPGFLGAVGGATATLAAPGLSLALTGGSEAASAASGAMLGPAITRQIPRTGQSLTALGLGTFLTFDLLPGAPRERIRDVFNRYVAGGGRILDASPLYGSAEASVAPFSLRCPPMRRCSSPIKSGQQASIWAMSGRRPPALNSPG